MPRWPPQHSISLTELNLFENDIADDGVRVLCESLRVNTSLLKLSLLDQGITDAGLLVIGDTMCMNRTITALDLSFNSIRDVMPLGAAFRVNPALWDVTLGQCWLNDASALSLAEFL